MSETIDSDPGAMSGEMEFRAEADDAWYTVRIVLQNEVLVVKYYEFPDEIDERFWAGGVEFSTREKIAAFRDRFRTLSSQVQDSECSLVKKGTLVCASSVSRNECRFYDAVVDSVKIEPHSFQNGTEECHCTFLVSWIHGPKAGTLGAVKIDNICLVQTSNEMDPRLASFLRISDEKLRIPSPDSGSVVGGGKCRRGSQSTSLECKFNLTLQQGEGSGPSTVSDRKVHGKFGCGFIRNLDQGGAVDSRSDTKQSSGPYIILIDNLDKCISSSSIMSFIYSHTSISANAYVFPCLLSESYTRGTLAVDSVEKLQKLSNFLNKPGQIITSSRGRPWVVLDVPVNDPCRSSYGCLELNSVEKQQHIKVEHGSEGDSLKVLRSGSLEYAKAEQLRDLFMEFWNHQQRLHKRLVFEERLVLQPSNLIC